MKHVRGRSRVKIRKRNGRKAETGLTDEEILSLSEQELSIHSVYPNAQWCLKQLKTFTANYYADDEPVEEYVPTEYDTLVDVRPTGDKKYLGYIHTPIKIVQDLGIISANIFGRVWSYSRMDSGVCTASQTTLAEDLGYNIATIGRHLGELCDAGYLDCEPRHKKTNIYRVTEKGLQTILT